MNASPAINFSETINTLKLYTIKTDRNTEGNLLAKTGRYHETKPNNRPHETQEEEYALIKIQTEDLKSRTRIMASGRWGHRLKYNTHLIRKME